MKPESSEEEILLRLEESLLQPSADLLADQFVEFGSSGQIYNKQQVIESLKLGPAIRLSITDFKTTTLAAGVVLVTYRACKDNAAEAQATYSLRSSIWKLIEGRWQIVFHQGTRQSNDE